MKLKVITVALALLVSASFSSNYKKDYCNQQTYFDKSGNDVGSKYPHLHCDKKFITYSKTKSNHINFLKGSKFNKGQADNACSQASSDIKKVIKEICEDEGKTCNECD